MNKSNFVFAWCELLRFIRIEKILRTTEEKFSSFAFFMLIIGKIYVV